MRAPERRQAILSESDVEDDFTGQKAVLGMLRRMSTNLPLNYVPETPIDYEPGPERRVGALARAQGKTPHEFIYDHYVQGDGYNFNLFFSLNFSHSTLDFLQPLFDMPNVLMGLGDGGAHVKIVTDAALPTFQLAFWARSRTRAAGDRRGRRPQAERRARSRLRPERPRRDRARQTRRHQRHRPGSASAAPP